MNWVNFLYIYQPPIQKPNIIQRVMDESYRPIFDILINNPTYKMNINMNSGLTDLILKNKGDDIIEKIKTLLNRKQIEITDTAAFQAFLPILPQSEIIRQIELNHSMHQNIFGNSYNPKGFFSPSLAYSEDLFQIIKTLGYKWIILDENILNDKIDPSVIYTHNGLEIYIRDRERSFSILSSQYDGTETLVTNLKTNLKEKQYFVTAMDGETFGHHKLNFEKTLEDLYAYNGIQSYLISEIPNIIKEKKEIIPKESTWIIPLKTETNVFERWYNPKNKIQKKQYQLIKLAINLIENSKYKIDDPIITKIQPDYLTSEQRTWIKARYLLDSALFQDQLFYSSAKPTWNIEFIEYGAYLLNKAIHLTLDVSKKNKDISQEYYEYILFTALKWQKSKKIQKIIEGFFEDEKIPEEISSPKLHLQGYIDAIKRLKLEMEKAKKVEDYETCQSLKERIIDIEKKKENFKLEQ